MVMSSTVRTDPIDLQSTIATAAVLIHDRPMPEYGRYCPIALATDVIADRWTPLIVRELVLGSTRFNEIARGLPGISRSLLTQRLGHLERKGVIERWPSPAGHGHEYHLTPAGKDLETVIMSLGRWAVHWLYDEIDPSDVDAVTLTWWMHRHVDRGVAPDRRVVVQFDHTAPERVRIWMVLDHGEPSVCIQHPGFDPDVIVTSSTPALAEVFGGQTTWRSAISAGRVDVDGPPTLVRSVQRWLLPSPFADDVREVARQRERVG
jgi:DNA-binding HxlR family transcriptional regulator